MNEQLLEDKMMRPLEIVNESTRVNTKPGVLKTLKGPLADYTEETRNGRLYKKELWEKVMESDQVKEMMETKTFFGETDHPPKEENRLEVKLKEVSHQIVDVWFDDSNGLVLGEIDILDTPNGRILNSLVEYGSQVGASSRGAGQVVEESGKNIVDTESYFFVTWDVVSLPSNKPARLESTNESVDIENKDIHSISEQVDSAIKNEDKHILRNYKTILEGTENEDFEPLITKLDEAINKESNEREESDKKKEVLKEDLKNAHETILELREEVEQLKGSQDLDVVESFMESKFDNINDYLQNIEEKFLSKIDEDLSTSSSLKEEVINKFDEIVTSLSNQSENTEKVTKLQERLNRKSNKVESLTEEVREYSSHLNSIQEMLGVDSYNEVKDTLHEINDDINTLIESNDEYQNKLADKNETIESLREQVSTLKETANKENEFVIPYTKELCSSEGVKYSTIVELLPESYPNVKIETIKKVINDFSEQNERVNRFKVKSDSYLNENSVLESKDNSKKSQDAKRLTRVIEKASK